MYDIVWALRKKREKKNTHPNKGECLNNTLKKFDEFAARLHWCLKWKVIGFIEKYPPKVVGVCFVYRIKKSPADDVVLIVAVGQTKWYPSVQNSKADWRKPTTLDELVDYHTKAQIVRVFAGIKGPRFRPVLVMYKCPILFFSEFSSLLALPLFLNQQPFQIIGGVSHYICFGFS